VLFVREPGWIVLQGDAAEVEGVAAAILARLARPMAGRALPGLGTMNRNGRSSFELPAGGRPCNTKTTAQRLWREIWSARGEPHSNSDLEYEAARSGGSKEGWSAARDTIRTLFLDPPPAVRSVFDQLVDEE
jgi:hypothetical protein